MRKNIFIHLLLFCHIGFVTPYVYAQSQIKESKFAGYLFAYFEESGKGEEQEQLRFAVSPDAVNWTALNGNDPIIASSEISKTGGIRDPHILRGKKENRFYMVATDMFTVKNGWDNNPGIVLMKSDNLLDWTHATLDVAEQYPEKFGNVKWIWAPQVFFDEKAEKYLVYFTVRFHGDEKLNFYAAYANEDFTGFEEEPTLLFSPKYGGIDGDIIYKDGLYHFFYKGNTKDTDGEEFKNDVQQATSKSLKGPWKEDFKYLDAYADTSVVVEGSSVFKLNDRDFHPRHGSVISITQEEARRLHAKWGGVPAALLQPVEPDDRYHFTTQGNPLITHHYTADPAALVEGNTLWLYAGHDFAGGQTGYKMKDWLVFSTTDMKNWTEYPVPMKIEDFSWAKSGDAYAAHVTERNGQYYWYISTNWSGIGVAVADRPEGPFKDALGKPLLTNDDCFASTHSWACIDPAVFIDDDGQAWIFWGNRECYYAKLKDNMTEIDGEIKQVEFEGFSFTEAPWIHTYNGKYYLTYATEFPEKIAYATADHIEGPYEYQGILNEIAGNSNTNHQAIVEFNGEWYFIYHNGGINTDGGSYSRSICIDRMHHRDDGTIKRIVMTTEGV